MSDMNIINTIKEEEERVGDLENAYGKELVVPYADSTSAQRHIMYSKHHDQAVQLRTPEKPLLMCGSENEFANYSSTLIKADSDYDVIGKVVKFDFSPSTNYWLIVKDKHTNRLDVIYKNDYKSTSESYGFQLDNSYLNKLELGGSINKGDIIIKPISIDNYGNSMKGVNMLSAYLSSDTTIEDGIKLSVSGAKKLSIPLVKRLRIGMNDNDIMLNLYGDQNVYKVLPDIGESIKDGIVCALRRENKNESLFSQSSGRLREIFMSDTKFTTSGRIVDLDISCNSPEMFDNNIYHSQIEYYHKNKQRYSQEIVDVISNNSYHMKLSNEANTLFTRSKKFLAGHKHMKDNQQFSGIEIELTIFDNQLMLAADKITNRYGGKGVAAIIVPDEEMLRLPDGRFIEMEYNGGGVVGRNNSSQLYELSTTRFYSKLIEYCKKNEFDYLKSFEEIVKFTYYINPKFARAMEDNLITDEAKTIYVQSIFQDKDNRMTVVLPPLNDINILTFEKIFRDYPWMQPEYLYAPVKGSNGKIRYVKTSKPIAWGYVYEYRLKQYSEDQFSATSLSSINIRGENTRNKDNKMYKSLISKTPIRWGNMEIGELMHMPSIVKLMNAILLYSSSPKARRQTEILLTGDPFNININIGSSATSRNVEILNTLLKTMGLKLVFSKTYKKLEQKLFFKEEESIVSAMKDGNLSLKFNENKYDEYIQRSGQKVLEISL